MSNNAWVVAPDATVQVEQERESPSALVLFEIPATLEQLCEAPESIVAVSCRVAR